MSRNNYAAYKLGIIFKDGNKRTFYSSERKGTTNTKTLNYYYNRLVNIAEKHKLNIASAIIWDNQNGSQLQKF